MIIRWIRETQSKLFVFGLIGSVYAFNFFGLWRLPYMDVDFPHPWDVYFYRSVQTVLSFLVIWLAAPHVFQRFRFKFRPKTFRIGLVFTIVASVPNIFYFGIEYKGFLNLVSGVVFAMAIGIDEEIFDRGFSFGAFERFGIEFALIASSVLFGLSHFTNYLYGDESLRYNLGHMVDAASFGYLMAAFMLMTGNIWFPIILHGMIDLPWILLPDSEVTDVISNGSDWGNVLIYTVSNIIMARLMLIYMRGDFKRINWPPSLVRALKFLGLVE